MNTPELRGQIDSARSSGSVDKELGWIGDFDNRDGEIRLRALSASDGGVWLFLNRESD